MKLKDQLTDEEYDAKREELLADKSRLKKILIIMITGLITG